MIIDRRSMLAATAAAAAFAMSSPLGAAPPAPAWFRNAIVIDGLGGIGDPYASAEQLRLSDRAWSEMLATGVTAVRDTLMPVSNVADAWGEYREAITGARNFLNANPDRLLLVRSAADILKAKRERKLAWVLGTQDTVMVGPVLDRLAEMKKDGVMTVQLTYNNGNLAGDGSLEPRNGGLTKLGACDDRADRGGKAAARPQPRRRADDGRGHGLREAAAGDQPYRRSGADRSPAQYRRRSHPRGRRQGRRGRASISCPIWTRHAPDSSRRDRPHRACRQGRGRGSCRHRQ